jgi:hypothetical protein
MGMLQDLIDSSPEPRARMSMVAEATFMFGLAAVVTAAFSILFSLSVLLGVLALAIGLIGLITTHRPDLAGSALNVLGMFLGFLALAAIAVRYLGIDTAVGDPLIPWLTEQLHHWNGKLPQPL